MRWGKNEGLACQSVSLSGFPVANRDLGRELLPRLQKNAALMTIFMMRTVLHQIDTVAAVPTILIVVRVMAVAVS
jgi:hypothetical protein